MNITKSNNKDKNFLRLTIGITIIVMCAVIVLNRKILPVPEQLPTWTYMLPKLNAIINATCAILLLLSLYFIKQKNIQIHKTINLLTFVLSSIFLISYIVFHWLAPETKYPDNAIRPIYLTVLISHIICAAIVLPLVLLSFYHGLKMQIDMHKKIVKYSYFIWLYVTITGVLVYLMISPYYPIQ